MERQKLRGLRFVGLTIAVGIAVLVAARTAAAWGQTFVQSAKWATSCSCRVG